MPETPDPLSAELAAIRRRAEAATEGPWWSDEDELMYRLHGVHARTPPYKFPGTDEVMIPEQVLNHQILKAPKSGTPYAEYWPNTADDDFITHARTDVPRLLAAVEAVLALHVPKTVTVTFMCAGHSRGGWDGVRTAGEQVDACPDCGPETVTQCAGCDPVCPDDNKWPCPTVLAASAALLGEEPGRD